MNKPKRKYVRRKKYNAPRKSKILNVLGKETYKSTKIKTTNLNRIYSEGKNLSTFNKYWKDTISNIRSSIENSPGEDSIYKNLFGVNFSKIRYFVSLVHNTKENSQKYYDMYNMLYTIYSDVTLKSSRVKIFTYGIRESPIRRETKFSKNMYVTVSIHEDINGNFSDNSHIEVKLFYNDKNNSDQIPVKVIAENKELYYSDTNSKLNIFYEVLLNNNNFDVNILEMLKISNLTHQADNLWNSSMIINYQNSYKSFELLNYKVCNISKVYNISSGQIPGSQIPDDQMSDSFLRLEKCCEVSSGNNISTHYNMYFDFETLDSDSPDWILPYLSDVTNVMKRLVVTADFHKKYLSANKININYLTISNFIQIVRNNPPNSRFKHGMDLMSISYNPSKNVDYYLLNLGSQYHLCNVTIVHKSYIKKDPYYNFFIRLENSGITRYTGPPKHEINLDNSNVYNFLAVISSRDIYQDFSNFTNASSNELFFSTFEIKFIHHNYSIINKSDKQPNLNILASENDIMIGPLILSPEKVIRSYNMLELSNPENILLLPRDGRYVVTDFSRFYEITEYSTINVKITNVVKSDTMDGYYQLTFNDGSLFVQGYEFNTTNSDIANFLNPSTPINSEYTSNIFGNVFILDEQNKLLDKVPISTRLSSIDNYLSRYNIFSMSILESNIYVLESLNISSLYNPNAKIYIEINSPGLVFYDKFSTVVYMDNSIETLSKLINQCTDLDLKYLISNNFEGINMLDYDVIFPISIKYKRIIFDSNPKKYSTVINLHLYNYKNSLNIKNDTNIDLSNISENYLLNYTSKILSTITSDNISDINIISHKSVSEYLKNIPNEVISKLLYQSASEFKTFDLGFDFLSNKYSYNFDEMIVPDTNVEIVENFYINGYDSFFRLSDNSHNNIIGCMNEYINYLRPSNDKLFSGDILFNEVANILSIKNEKSDINDIASFLKLNVNIITKLETNILKRLYGKNNYYNNIYIYLDSNNLYRLCRLELEEKYIKQYLDLPKALIFTGNKEIECTQNILNLDSYEEIIFEINAYLEDKMDEYLFKIINILENNLKLKIESLDIQKYSDQILDAEPNLGYIILDGLAKIKLYYPDIQNNITIPGNSLFRFHDNSGKLEKSIITVYYPGCVIIRYKSNTITV